MIQCTAHPAKGDLLAFEGLQMEEEEKLERFAVAVQLNQLLHSRKRMSRYFSKELIQLADPFYGSSDDDSPRPRRKQKKRTRPPARSSACSKDEPEAESASEEENGDLSSMAALFQQPAN